MCYSICNYAKILQIKFEKVLKKCIDNEVRHFEQFIQQVNQNNPELTDFCCTLQNKNAIQGSEMFEKSKEKLNFSEIESKQVSDFMCVPEPSLL